MDIKAARHYTRKTLAADESDYLLSFVLGKDRAWLYAHSEYRLNKMQSTRLRQLVEKRKVGKPLAYLKGYQEFYGLKFFVNETVLIPRPETEIAVAYAINHIPTHARLLDLGTGCGNIAIAVAYHRPDLTVTASDLSSLALEVAQNNARQHRCKISFVQSDWYRNIKGPFDWIISNPPYIAANDPDADYRAIAAEPQLALYAEDDGEAGLSAVIADAKTHLAKQGILIVEHGHKQAETVVRLMQCAGFSRTRSLKDTADYLRYTIAQ